MTLTSAEIRAIFQACCLSDQKAARLLGVTDRTIRRWRRGGIAPHAAQTDGIRAIEAIVRQMVDAAVQQIDAAGPDVIALVGYRKLVDMLPGTGPPAIELHQAMLAALRLRYGDRLRIVDFDGVNYAVWLGDRDDTQAMRGMWASERCAAGD